MYRYNNLKAEHNEVQIWHNVFNTGSLMYTIDFHPDKILLEIAVSEV